MLYKSLILGVLFSIGIFAVKSGVGIAYLSGQKQRKREVGYIILLYALAYGAVFGVAALLMPLIDPVRHLATIQTFIQSGMMVHLAIAALMIVWGVLLLKHHGPSSAIASGKSSAWLLLVLPCPVCMTVIWLCSAFLVTCFPNHSAKVVSALYLAFVSIGLASMLVIHHLGKRSTLSSEATLGAAMLLMAAYFLVSVTVMPQFGDLDKVYRLASYPDERSSTNFTHWIGMTVLAVTAFGAGFGVTSMKTRRLR